MLHFDSLFEYLEWRDGEGSSVNSTSHLDVVRSGKRKRPGSGQGQGMSTSK